MGFDLVSNQSRSGGTFAATPVNGSADRRNAAIASTAVATTPAPFGPGLVLPAGETTLPATNGVGDRGIFGPYRLVADLGSKNSPGIGRQNLSTTGSLATVSTLEFIVVNATLDPLTYVDPETGENGPYFGRNDFYGLDTWVPVFTTVYNLHDLQAVELAIRVQGATPDDPGVRGFRGINNSNDVDLWKLDIGSIPKFSITVPGPGPSAVAVAGGALLLRRRRNRLI